MSRPHLLAAVAIGGVLALFLCGCSTRASRLSDGPALSLAEQEARRVRYVLPDDCGRTVEQRYALLSSEAERRTFRDELINARIGIIDTVYADASRVLRRGRAAGRSAVDISTLTINSIGALVGPAQTKAILHAISGGLIGASASLESNFYENMASTVLIDRMDALRQERLREIRRKSESLDTVKYKLSEAINDCDEYLREGTIERALVDIAKDNGVKTEKNEGLREVLVEERIAIAEAATDAQIASNDRIGVQIASLTEREAEVARAVAQNLDPDFPREVTDSKAALREYFRGGAGRTDEVRAARDSVLLKAIKQAKGL